MEGRFKLVAPFKPAGDQPAAIDALCKGVLAGKANQTLLGVTGSGKTFAVAAAIERLQRPALVISPNKVLAAQLYGEFKTFFPENAVEYFVSYYDYYQPEAYIPSTDTYIEKDSSINDHIDKLRLKATASILTRPDTLVVASVSCIYNIGSPENFSEFCLTIKKGQRADRKEFTRALVDIHYERNEMEFKRGCFRLRGANLDIFPGDGETAWRVQLGDTVEALKEIDPLTGGTLRELEEITVFPAKHFVTGDAEIETAAANIEAELAGRLAVLKGEGKLLEAERLSQRVRYDLEMIRQTGFCSGIENYSRHLAGRPAGSRPDCLFDYYKKGFLLFIDESHVTLPQIRGMYAGDRARKQTLVDFGFRLPSALDNRPLKFDEFEALRPATVFVSATPGPYELANCAKEDIVDLIIRPTGLVDPQIRILPVTGQIKALTAEIEKRAAKSERTLVLTLTKKTAEDLSEYLKEKGLKARYMHSDMDTLERLDILSAFRKGEFDALVGINLLREGLDIPEVTLVAILNADNEGFLRSETTLIQISGRAARNLCGEVILFADRMTGSMERAIAEMKRRRDRQTAYNKKHGIEPRTIIKKFVEFEELRTQAKRQGLNMAEPLPKGLPKAGIRAMAGEIESRMREAAENLNFELAAELRDRLYEIREMSGVKSKPSRRGKK
ncbi:MAG TPA: excinuclease ABC subunit B [Elusimicrobia bacterium]|nr:MAG: excinuclease ABC subunit B [Elusimicrobia bacterium GWA2_64_40]OGR66753.1 MAG: excinuclease ABC subunit B [Elusimicrobia bacterium GWB2_63_16]HAU88840.1 excinuclease ABC subunit B [Elusimicrobiota bacterium]